MGYVGLSLSFCVRDIAAGVIPLEEVVGIKSSTAATDTEGWERLLEEYKHTYWAKDPERCVSIARKLIDTEGVIQPRLEGKPVPNLSMGWWEKDGRLLTDKELKARYSALGL